MVGPGQATGQRAQQTSRVPADGASTLCALRCQPHSSVRPWHVTYRFPFSHWVEAPQGRPGLCRPGSVQGFPSLALDDKMDSGVKARRGTMAPQSHGRLSRRSLCEKRLQATFLP